MQADALAFFGMELGGEDVITPDGGGEIPAIFGLGGDDALVRRLRIKAVDEIDIAAAFDIAEERAIGPGNLDLVPADLRNLQAVFFGKADNAAFEDAQTGSAGVEFLASFKQRLVTDADAQEKLAALDVLLRRAEQFLFAHGIDAIIERADAGQDHGAGVADLFGRFGDAHVGADLKERLVDAAQVAGAVIEKGNHPIIKEEKIEM